MLNKCLKKKTRNRGRFFSTTGKREFNALNGNYWFNLRNRFGAPTRPLRSLDDMIAFLSGSETYNDLADFTSYSQSTDVNKDQMLGLDSWMSEEDSKMMQYYKHHMKNAGGHWFHTKLSFLFLTHSFHPPLHLFQHLIYKYHLFLYKRIIYNKTKNYKKLNLMRLLTGDETGLIKSYQVEESKLLSRFGS